MSDKNYQNFIYLFNDKNFINVVQKNLYPSLSSVFEFEYDFKEFLGQLAGQEAVILGLAGEEGNRISTLGYNQFKDYPKNSLGEPNYVEEQEFLLRTAPGDAQAKGFSSGPPIASPTNDPFRSPHKKVLFETSGDSPEALNLIKLFPDSPGSNATYTSRLRADLEAAEENIIENYLDIEEITKTKYAAIFQTSIVPLLDGVSNYHEALNPNLQETNTEFLYTQRSVIALNYTLGLFGDPDYEGVDVGINLKEQKLYQTTQLFSLYSTAQINNDGTGFKTFSTQDISTMIGVPYDIHTLQENSIEEKSYIHLLQPKYEKIYNYYDPQYEPLISAVIDQNVITETSLPSIYDFLYLERDYNSIINFLTIPGMNESTYNLSNLNQYLDNFANLYADYLQLEVDGVTVSGYIGEDYFDQDKNLAALANTTLTLDQQDFIVQNEQVKENSKLPWTDSTAMLQQFPYLAEISKNSKVGKVPLWVGELKTGVYFSEDSLKTFNQTLDKDSVFPFLVKINIPTETKGTLANIFSQNDVLDAFNTHAASITIPQPEGFEEAQIPATVAPFYGGVINGDANENYKLFSDALMPTFKMYFENEPSVPTPENIQILQDVLGINSPVRKEFIEKFGVLLTGDFGQSDDQPALNLDSFISFILDGGITPKMQEFLKATEPALDVAGTLKKIVKLFQSMKKYKKEYGIAGDLFLDTLFTIGDNTLKKVFVYKDENKTQLESELSSLISQLKLINFKKSLKDTLIQKKLLRTAVDVQNGKFAHQETFMYEIAKYGFDEEGNEVYIQSIFLPITDNTNLSYYDTQIIPRKKYHYKIFAHKVIVGTDYRFVPGEKLQPLTKIASINTNPYAQTNFYQANYEIKPYLQFVRVPYYNVSLVNTKNDEINYTMVDDKPPLPPLVNFVPYRGINDKILVLMNNSIGEAKRTPIIMFEEDKQLIQDVAVVQGKNYETEQLQIGDRTIDIYKSLVLDYKSDDQEGVFQAYRIVNEPTSYNDFEKDLSLKVFELNVEGNFKNDSFQDDIVPNVDYYYTFRFQDIHGKISNPTEVYKVRMEQSVGTGPYLKIETLNLLKKQKDTHDEKFVTSKVAQKYIMIRPSDDQNNVRYKRGDGSGDLSYDEDGFPVDPDIGYENVVVEVGDQNKSVFGRKFKLRVTSKQTGKKIDVNFTVKQPEIVINETGNIQYEKT